MNITKRYTLITCSVCSFIHDAGGRSRAEKEIPKMLQKISISDKCCSSDLSIHQRNLKTSAQLLSTS